MGREVVQVSRPRRRSLLALLCLAPLAGLFGPASGCRSPELTVAGATPSACAECHAEVAEEWAGSAHARAWSSLAFQRQADPSCYACHAPGPLQEGPLVARDVHRERGVDCQACHLDPAGALVGPFRADRRRLTEVHPVRRDYFSYRTSRLCARCHETTREEAEELQPALGGIALSCQECHMPAVARRITQDGDALTRLETSISRTRRQRRHVFGAPAEPPDEKPLLVPSWSIERDAGGGVTVRASVASQVPHLLPTGERTALAWTLTLRALDTSGAEVGRVERRLARDDGTALAPGAPVEVAGAFPADTARLLLQVLREGRAPRTLDERGVSPR